MTSGSVFKFIRNHLITFLLLYNVVSFGIFAFVTHLNRSNESFIYLIFIPLSAYGLTVVVLEYKRIQLTPQDIQKIWVYSIFVRLFVLFYPIGLSDDIYRYIWDGYLQHQNVNPYQFAPESQRLDMYRTMWSGSINNPHIASPYPPFAQILFYLLTSVSTDINISTMLFRITFMFFDLGVILIIKGFLKEFEIPDRRLIIYAWSPLVILEFTGNAHIDIVAIFFSLIAILYQKQSKYNFISPIALCFAIFTKVFPLVLLPFLFIKWNIKQKITFMFTSVVIFLPFVTQDVNPLFPKGQQSYVRYFKFNESVFRILTYLLQGLSNAEIIARFIFIIVMLFVSGICFLLFLQKRTQEQYIISYQFIVLLALLLGPNAQPWYVIWILPLAALFFNPGVILWSMTVLLSYQLYPLYDRTGVWKEEPVILLIEYVPVYALFLYTSIKSYLEKRVT